MPIVHAVLRAAPCRHHSKHPRILPQSLYGKPAVRVCQELLRIGALTLLLPQPRQAHGRAVAGIGMAGRVCASQCLHALLQEEGIPRHTGVFEKGVQDE